MLFRSLMIRGAKEGCVVERRVKGCDIVCVTEVRRYVECMGGTDECNRMNKMVQLEEGALVKVSNPWGSLHTTQGRVLSYSTMHQSHLTACQALSHPPQSRIRPRRYWQLRNPSYKIWQENLYTGVVFEVCKRCRFLDIVIGGRGWRR